MARIHVGTIGMWTIILRLMLLVGYVGQFRRVCVGQVSEYCVKFLHLDFFGNRLITRSIHEKFVPVLLWSALHVKSTCYVLANV